MKERRGRERERCLEVELFPVMYSSIHLCHCLLRGKAVLLSATEMLVCAISYAGLPTTTKYHQIHT